MPDESALQSDSYLSAQMECFPSHLEKMLINTLGMYLVHLVENANSLIFYSLEPFVWIVQVSNRLHWDITETIQLSWKYFFCFFW